MSSREQAGEGDREGTGVPAGVVLMEDIVGATGEAGAPDYFTYLVVCELCECVCACG